MLRFRAALSGVAALIAGAGWALSAASDQSQTAAPVVVELFTSQSCSSCVPATHFLEELAGRRDIIALGWHVDYWDRLNTRHGAWKDPYSDAAYTARQRVYNQRLRNTGSVYTPQMVIAGASEAVGSAREEVDVLIKAARMAQTPGVIGARRAGGNLVFDIVNLDRQAHAYLVSFTPGANTDVRRGENAGVAFRDVNIVTAITDLGIVRRARAQITAPAPDGNQHCALLVHEPGQGRIVAAAYCPAS